MFFIYIYIYIYVRRKLPEAFFSVNLRNLRQFTSIYVNFLSIYVNLRQFTSWENTIGHQTNKKNARENNNKNKFRLRLRLRPQPRLYPGTIYTPLKRDIPDINFNGDFNGAIH